MAREMTMNIAADIKSQETKTFVPQASILYSPLPGGKNATGVGKNKIFFSLFSPAAWSMHQVDPSDPLNSVLFPDSIPPDLWTFYWKLHGHYTEVQTSNGPRTQFILCPIQQNKYQVETLKYKPLFRDARCRSCEEAASWWDKFNKHWESGNVIDPATQAPVKADRWSYDKNAFAAIQKNNSQLTQLRDEAGRFSVAHRWIFEVFDVDKFTGTRQMDEGEDQVDFQFYFGPKTIFDGLNNLHTMGVKFYDADLPQTVLLIKDCSEGVRQAKYQISNLGPMQVNDEEKAFLGSESSLKDLKVGGYGADGAIFYALSYEEQALVMGLGTRQAPPPQSVAAAQQQSAPTAMRPRMGAPVQAPVQQQVQAPVQQQVQAPVQQQVQAPPQPPMMGVQVPPQPSGLTAPTPPSPPKPTVGANPVPGRKRGDTQW